MSNRTVSEAKKSGKILWLGWGDLARKCKVALSQIKDQGYQVSALDVTDKPTGLDSIEPDRLFLRSDQRALVKMAKNDGFDMVYIGNYGHQHIASALEFQHFTPLVIVAKPLDTCLDFLLTIERDRAQFDHLLRKMFVHDHYLNKPGVMFLRDVMPRLHAEHSFLSKIVMFLVERDSIETKEVHRLESLECGVLFDLAVHMLGVLQAVVPVEMAWHYDGQGDYARTSREISVTACNTGRYAGSLLGDSTVMHGRKAETFGVIELSVHETIVYEGLSGIRREIPRQFEVLIVVGKGIPGEYGMTRDLKTVMLTFDDESEVALDLDTYLFKGIDPQILEEAGYDRIQFKHRGINLPLLEALGSGFALTESNNFQPYAPALDSIRCLSEALRLAPSHPLGHKEHHTSCRDLLSALVRQANGFTEWQRYLPDNFQNLLIGAPPVDSIS